MLPTFGGGGAKVFREWLQGRVDSLAEPDVRSDPQRLVVRFIVERDGSMTYDRDEMPTESSLEKTVREILPESPAWTPALLAGEKVRYKVAIPVAFGPGADEARYADEDAFSGGGGDAAVQGRRNRQIPDMGDADDKLSETPAYAGSGCSVVRCG